MTRPTTPAQPSAQPSLYASLCPRRTRKPKRTGAISRCGCGAKIARVVGKSALCGRCRRHGARYAA